ncbi:MAG: hypothetical protein GX660_03700 [Clostridiaceae bacterium]|nr:hypothetical protein [Clostridiaceae bacterium]
MITEAIEIAIENGTCFAKCLKTVEDDVGVYCITGKVYNVIDFCKNELHKDCYLIECEQDGDELMISIDDKDFEFFNSNEE